jgi:hypothetical protein
MTISSIEDPVDGPYPGNDSQTEFPFYFKTVAKTDVKGVLADPEGEETVLVLDSDFSIALNADQNANPGGTMTYPLDGGLDPLPTDWSVTIESNVQFTQPADIVNAGAFHAAVHEDTFDRIVMLVKQVNATVRRALQLGVSTPAGVDVTLPTPVPLNILGWNDDGTQLRNFGDADGVTVIVQADDLAEDLADSSSSAVGTGLIGWLRAATGAVASTLYAWLDWQHVHVFEFMTMAQRIDVKACTHTLDTLAAINAANAAAAAKTAGGVVKFAAGLYRTSAVVSIPNKVSWEGEGYPQTNNAGTVWDCGAAIWPAHNGDAIRMVSSNNAGSITRIGVWGDKATYPAGRGIVMGPAAGCHLEECSVRNVGGAAMVFGDNTANSYTNTARRCYVNNPGGQCFVVGGRYFRGDQLISDGGTVAFETLSLGVSASLNADCHFEGFTVSALKLGADAFKIGGRVQTVSYVGNLVHVDIPSLAAITNIVLNGLDLGSASAGAGSVGVRIGALCTGVRINDSYIGFFETGILDGGNRNQVHRTRFFDNVLPYNANGDLYTIKNNIFRNTTGLYEIAHNSGTRGIWAENDFQKSLNPVVTGVQGNFGGIKVRDNLGYVSRNVGQTAAIASGAFINHGLGPVTGGGATPSPDIVITPSLITTTPTSVVSLTSTSTSQIQFSWTGGVNLQLAWCAHLPCDY